MSFVKLLAAGKSLVGLPDGESRYRADKRARLPKFGSPKNPFASAEKAATASAPAMSTQPTAAEKQAWRAASEAKAAGWFSEWGKKLNPLSHGSKPAGPARSLAPLPAKPSPQGELSLDRVKVLRNDLSDSDLEVVRPPAAKPVSPVMAMTAAKLEPVGAAWNRLTTKFFGVDQT